MGVVGCSSDAQGFAEVTVQVPGSAQTIIVKTTTATSRAGLSVPVGNQNRTQISIGSRSRPRHTINHQLLVTRP